MICNISHQFKIEIQEIHDDEAESVIYQASCSDLSGCIIHAQSLDEAKHKIEQAIDIWLHFANKQLVIHDLDFDSMIG